MTTAASSTSDETRERSWTKKVVEGVATLTWLPSAESQTPLAHHTFSTSSLRGPLPITRSATEFDHQAEELHMEVDRLLSIAMDEPYRDGMFGMVFQAAREFLRKTSIPGVQMLTNRLFSPWINKELAAEVVRHLSRVRHSATLDDRLVLAEWLLLSDAPVVRDHAASALADLEDLSGIEALEEAIERESIPSLKEDMELALEDLRHYGVAAPEA